MGTAAGAIQKTTYRDRAAFVASRRAIRTRPATAEEKAAAGLRADADAATVLIRLCKGVIKVVAEKHELFEDVTEAAEAIAKADGRPFLEVLDAAKHLPLIPAGDLLDLSVWLMADRAGCARCTCAGGYAPLAVGLAQAAAQVSNPASGAALDHAFETIKGARPGPIKTDAPGVQAIADAIRTIIRAAGFTDPHTA